MKENAKKVRNWDILITFLIVFIIKEIFVVFFAEPLRTPMDEMSTIVSGAYFGGLDWTNTTTFANFYYGGGITMLFAPVFYLTDNPYIIYGVILTVCAMLQSVGAPISNYIFQKYFNMDRKISYVASIACGFMVCTRAMLVYNEHGLIFAAWVIALLVCKLLEYGEQKSKKNLYSVLLMGMICYSLTFHTRAKTYLYAVIVFVVIFWFLYQKMLVSPVYAIVSGVVFYGASKVYIEYIKTHIWLWQEGMPLKNTSLNFNGLQVQDLFSPVTWEAWASIVIGQVNTAMVFSGGIAVFMLVLIWVFLLGIFKKRVAGLNGKESTEEGKGLQSITFENDLKEKLVFALALIFIMCIGATILTQSITWLKRVVEALEGAAYGTNAYGYKAFTYVRYMAPYLGPVFMVGIICIYQVKEKLRKWLLPSALLLIGLHGLWLCYILPHITNNKTACEVFAVFGGYSFWGTDKVEMHVYMAGTAVMLFSACLCCIYFYKKKIMQPTAFICLLLIYQYCYGAYFIDAGYNHKFSQRVNGGYEFVKEIEKNTENEKWFPKEIYAIDSNTSVQKFVYTYQFMLNRYKIIPQLPEKPEEVLVFTTNKKVKEFKKQGYRTMKLDENEYLCVMGQKYIDRLEELGYVLE